MTDEDYLVMRAKMAQKNDDAEAKAWLITARTLFPKNFKIQLEAYSMHKNSGNIMEAARNLEIMFLNFQHEELLWREVRAITDSLRSEIVDSNSKFLRELYSRLCGEVQRGLLLTAAERTEDIIEHCKILIMLLEKFPECTAQHGMLLIENLLNTEKHTYSDSPVNNLRKLLVGEILPLVLKAPSVDISQVCLYTLLHKSIEYCVYVVMKPYGREESGISGMSGGRDRTVSAESPWQELAVVVELIGQKIGWELHDIFKSQDLEAQWQRLNAVCNLRHLAVDDSTSFIYRQILYCATILFLRGFCEYVAIIDPSYASGTIESRSCSAALIEGLRTYGLKFKKPKLEFEGKDENIPELTVSAHVGQTTGNLVHSFLTAVRCWDLLHATELLATDFSELCQHLLIDSWPCFQSFQIDVLIYKGIFTEAVQWLSDLPIPNSPGYREKIMLQAACCFYQLGEYTTACNKALDVVCSVAEKPSADTSMNGNVTALSKPGRNLVFLSLTMVDVLNFCIKLIVARLQEVVVNSRTTNDIAMGHLLVLLQYDWPNEENLFLEIIERIKQHGSFSFPIFFNYIINIDILEEFAHLSLPVGGNLTFSLLPSTSSNGTKQRAITRGVNKGAKEELKLAIEKQVARCGESICPVLVDFLTNERETLFENVHGP